jgi:hypothetical protein
VTLGASNCHLHSILARGHLNRGREAVPGQAARGLRAIGVRLFGNADLEWLRVISSRLRSAALWRFCLETTVASCCEDRNAETRLANQRPQFRPFFSDRIVMRGSGQQGTEKQVHNRKRGRAMSMVHLYCLGESRFLLTPPNSILRGVLATIHRHEVRPHDAQALCAGVE